ncbi:photosystem II [Salvia divinorum]|uniref:Photosystem II n=1 Tax=Salvia divinorum TaxID=28513 RepID=A0ABD1HYJ7_SALDI
MGFCEASVSKVGDVEEDIFAVKMKNTYDDEIGIGDDIVKDGGVSEDKEPSSEDVASKTKKKGGKNRQEEDDEEEKIPNQPAKHEEEATSKKKPEETLPQFSVVEVRVVEGATDVVLVNGLLRVGDCIVVGAFQGPVVTSIRALLTPHPVKKLRLKGEYLHHKKIKISQGIKIAAPGLEHAIAGASLYVVRPNDDIDLVKKSAMECVDSVMSRIDRSGEGVYVQASTLASVAALLKFCKTPEVNLPVGGMSIGAVQKTDVTKALGKRKKYATILAFGVEVTPEASQLAQQLGVKIFTSDTIHRLFLQFKSYMDKIEAAEVAVFPCVLKIVPGCVINAKDPIVLGVDVVQGVAKIGTPICVPGREFVEIGWIVYIQDDDHRVLDYATKGQRVTINILGSNPEERKKMVGRHFEMEDELVSKITPDSVDALREEYLGDDLSTEDIELLFELKQLFKI